MLLLTLSISSLIGKCIISEEKSSHFLPVPVFSMYLPLEIPEIPTEIQNVVAKIR